MKLYDCTTYYDEEMILDLRFNTLNQYIDKFIVCEAKFTHSGRKKKLNFDINKFSKFKDKIIYLVVENEPENLIYEDKENYKHVLIQQYYNEIPIWGKEMYMHFDEKNELYLINGRYTKTPKDLDLKEYEIDAEIAVKLAKKDLSEEVELQELSFEEEVFNKIEVTTKVFHDAIKGLIKSNIKEFELLKKELIVHLS